jgi:BNR repeat-like domain
MVVLGVPICRFSNAGELETTGMVSPSTEQLRDCDPDVRVSAAGAVLHIDRPRPPRIVLPEGGAPIVWPDGSLRIFGKRKGRLAPRISRDGGRTWSEPDMESALPDRAKAGDESDQLLLDHLLLDRSGELHAFWSQSRGQGQPAVGRFIDLWHARSSGGRSRFGRPRRIFEGYVGSLQGAYQLTSGRLVVPFASWIGNRPSAPPTGSNITTVVFSDDDGATWRQSDARLTAPCQKDYNGSNYGACEPVLVELRDGRCWMLMRTQTGRLYESFSKDGADWSPAKPSRFYSSNSPAELVRIGGARLAVIWNNCQTPPRRQGQGVYGGRDALHMALSDDDGRTWRGFREIYRDRAANQSPPQSGDRGTAYPCAIATPAADVLVVSGQGGGRRVVTLVDVDWLLETRQHEDFAQGLDGWTVFKSFGPAHGWWRDRKIGARLVDHPSRNGAHALWLARPDNDAPDGAVWNFPAGHSGELRLSVLLPAGSSGGSIALADRFFDPTDDAGESEAMFRVRIAPRAGNGLLSLAPDKWHTIALCWDAGQRTCRVDVDGTKADVLRMRGESFAGPSYLRLRSDAGTMLDEVGWLVERVDVEVQP